MLSKMRGQLSPGELVSAAGGVLLVVTLVLPWFHEESQRRFAAPGDPTFDGRSLLIWTTVPVVAFVLVALAAVPLVNAVRRAQTGTSMRPEVLLATGALALAVVLFGSSLHLGDQGTSRGGLAVVTASPTWGMVASLLTTLVIAVGGAMAMWRRPPGSAPRPAP